VINDSTKPRCKTCDNEIEWVDCYNCDYGEIDMFDTDPNWYDGIEIFNDIIDRVPGLKLVVHSSWRDLLECTRL
jgi:arsenate reductase-like glutaredoxin family protein